MCYVKNKPSINQSMHHSLSKINFKPGNFYEDDLISSKTFEI